MTSDELLGECGRSFSSLVIIGGGVIGLEFASIYANLGSEVTVIEALDRILPSMDPEISQAVAAIMKRRGIRISTSAKLEKIEDVGRLRCSFIEKTRQVTVEADGVLVAAGRKPNIDGLFGPGIEPEMSGGCIKVDDNYMTSIDGIYAVGDVIGGLQLAHLASAQGTAAVAGMFGEKAGIDFSAVPSCVYTEPEIASVGLTLDEAIQRGIPAKAARYQMISNGRSVIESQDRGFVKIVFDVSTGIVIGAQIVSGRATDMISELTTAISAGLTAAQLASVIRPHPTFSEGVSKAVEIAMEILAADGR
jgi:dihydrolipoamide dehydrogenase